MHFPVEFEDMDSVRTHYPGLFIPSYQDGKEEDKTVVIEKSKIGEFIHHGLRDVVSSFGITNESHINLLQNPEVFKSQRIINGELAIAMISLKEYFGQFYQAVQAQHGKALDRPWLKHNYLLLDAFGEREFIDQPQTRDVLEAIVESLDQTSLRIRKSIYTGPLQDYVTKLITSMQAPQAEVITLYPKEEKPPVKKKKAKVVRKVKEKPLKEIPSPVKEEPQIIKEEPIEEPPIVKPVTKIKTPPKRKKAKRITKTLTPIEQYLKEIGKIPLLGKNEVRVISEHQKIQNNYQ